jgi:hypothetical protein
MSRGARFCGERLDVWLLRHSSAAETRHGWHGVGELAHCSTAEALGRRPTLWLFGGARPRQSGAREWRRALLMQT